MLSEKEQAFIDYWKNTREAHSSFSSKLLRGLPMAMLFGLPILLSIAAVYLFSPEWYTKISSATQGSFSIILIAVLIAVLFFSYFRMHFKWEMNEQAYEELLNKQRIEEAANK